MGSTGDPSGEPSLAPCGPVTSSRKRGAGRKGAPATHDICPALSDLYHAQYQSLFRLAVLLTGNADVAKAVVLDSFAALYRPRKRPQTEDDALPPLRRRLVARSRLARHHHPWDGSRRPLAGGEGPPAAPALRTRHAARRLGRDPGSAQAANRPAGSDRAHSLPGPQPQAGRHGHAGEPGHAATLGPGRSALRAVMPSNPLNTTRTATGSVRRSARPAAPRQGTRPGNPRAAGSRGKAKA
jgi:hypothetical protein